MDEQLPRYDAPPVVETVLGVQFAPIAGYTTAHAGRFWQAALPDWKTVREVPHLEDQFEDFEPGALWRPQGGFAIRPMPAPRIHIIRDDEERLLQVQDSRFIYNWRRKSGDYPSYGVIRPEFDERFEQFRAFIDASGFEKLLLNQWEVTYVNHIPEGDDQLWQTIGDWERILPGLGLHGLRAICALESMKAEWRAMIGDKQGRLHIELQHGKRSDGAELMILKLTARGPIDPMSLGDGLDLGHRSIVRTFDSITSEEAHRFWNPSP